MFFAVLPRKEETRPSSLAVTRGRPREAAQNSAAWVLPQPGGP